MPAVMACWSRMKTESNPSEGRQKCLPSFCCVRLSVQNRPGSACLRPESLKRKHDRIPHWHSFWGIRAGLGVCLWIGLPRDFTIVPEDYGRSFPDSRPDAFLAHQKAADSISARFHRSDRFTAKNPLRIISRGDFQEFVSASCSWRQCRPILQR